MTQAMRRKVSDHVYSAGVHVSASGHVTVLAGSRDVTRPCLRLLTLSDNGKLEAAAELAKPGTSVRCSILLEATGSSELASYLTGGEDGVLRLWRRSDGDSVAAGRAGGKKIGGHEVRERNKPYSKA